jgi:hypothetical protein
MAEAGARAASVKVCRFRRFGGLIVRALIEDSLRLDMSHPVVRRVIGAREHRRGAFQWCDSGVAAADVGYIWRPGARVLELRFIADGVSVTQNIKVVSAPARFGGRRTWFQCPETLQRARALFLPPGRTRWAGRTGHKLAYASQQMRPNAFTALGRELDRNDAADRRNHVRRLRRRERARIRPIS